MTYALVDGNNFYASCERVFDPALRGVPVCILSNNDGCIIARSSEVKAAGIPMGAPVHKWRAELRAIGARVLSSNFALYGDMSGRVMATLRELTDLMEVYSIDEAFVQTGNRQDLAAYGEVLRWTTYQYTGIPVSVGFGATKTLAKLANWVAKKYKGGLFILEEKNREAVLRFAPVEAVWGVGRSSEVKLRRQGITTAWDLSQQPDAWVKQQLTVVGLRTVHELRGQPCFELQESPEARKNLVCSRSFGRVVTDRAWLRQAVATHTARAAEKLRQQSGVATGLSVFMATNPFREQDSQYHQSHYQSLPVASHNTAVLIKAALAGFEHIYRGGFNYHKAGIRLSGLRPASQVQYNLFTPEGEARSGELMGTLDQLNQQYGSHTVQWGAMGLNQPWQMKSEHRSPAYTTNWADRPVVKA